MGSPLKIEWIEGDEDADHAVDPAYPHGRDLVDNPEARTHCLVRLPYPAMRSGQWRVTCGKCRKSVVIDAAGREDDPCSLSLACTLSVLQKEAGNVA
jgi:hypothetical protein